MQINATHRPVGRHLDAVCRDLLGRHVGLAVAQGGHSGGVARPADDDWVGGRRIRSERGFSAMYMYREIDAELGRYQSVTVVTLSDLGIWPGR